MRYGSITVSQMARIANICAAGVNYIGSSKGAIMKDFRLDGKEPFYSKLNKEKFHRICKKADAEIKKLRDEEWNVLNKIIYEDKEEG